MVVTAKQLYCNDVAASGAVSDCIVLESLLQYASLVNQYAAIVGRQPCATAICHEKEFQKETENAFNFGNDERHLAPL